jgi:RNA polymerase sigma-70 factor (ECF subfamily)
VITKTNTRLLEELADPSNQAVWREFDARYRTLVVRFAKRSGLSDEDAADEAQDARAGFARDYRSGSYDRDKGRLRTWLFGIARNRIFDVLRLAARRRRQVGAAEEPIQESAALEDVWEQEWRAATLRLAVDEVRRSSTIDPRTMQAFDLVVLASQSPREAARIVNMTVDEVYVAKSRVLSRIRGVIAELELEEV